MQAGAFKITSKGQVTLPKNIRNILQSDVVEFEVINGDVVIRPVKSVSGALSAFAQTYKPLKEIKDSVWEEAAREKATKSR
jgi:AbrB family looped-hinge helix DNA binding protein